MPATAANTAPAQPSMFRNFRFLKAEREVFRRKEDLTVSQWAEKYRMVPIGAHKGPWVNDITPYATFIMDTWGLPHVREVVLLKSPQTGGTEIMYNCEAFAMDRDPSTAMFVMPTQPAAKKVSTSRIIPMILNSPQLSRHLSGNPDDLSKFHIRLANGEEIFLAHSNSADALASFPIKRLYFDETDKYPATVKEETDPISLGEKRTRTYRHTHKRFYTSTPTRKTGHIWKAWKNAEVQYHRHVYCPDCGGEQVMRFEQIRYPKDRTGRDIQREKLARYECEHCKSLWSDSKRELAVRCGHWAAHKGAEILQPLSVAFHLPSWLSPDVSLSEIAAAWIDAQTDDAKKIDFYNDYCAWIYEEEHKAERKEEQIRRLVDQHMPRGIVPRDTSTLLLLVDTQQIGFHYEVAAFGWGKDLTSHRVDNGYVEHFDHLKELAEQRWNDADGREYGIVAAFIDSGGGTNPAKPKHSRTKEVYEFCIDNPIFHPLKGRRDQATPWNVTRLEFFPSRDGKKIPIPGGLNLYTINVTIYKNQLSGKLSINPESPGAFLLHAETDEEYAKQMCAEYQDDRGFWICLPGRANHFWDLGVYRFAAADIVRIRTKQKPEETKPQPKPAPASTGQSRPSAPRLPGWFRGRG